MFFCVFLRRRSGWHSAGNGERDSNTSSPSQGKITPRNPADRNSARRSAAPHGRCTFARRRTGRPRRRTPPGSCCLKTRIGHSIRLREPIIISKHGHEAECAIWRESCRISSRIARDIIKREIPENVSINMDKFVLKNDVEVAVHRPTLFMSAQKHWHWSPPYSVGA